MLLMIPVQDGHEWTERVLRQLAETVAHNHGTEKRVPRGAEVSVCILDNASLEPYHVREFNPNIVELLNMDVVRIPANVGYYKPLSGALNLYGPDHELIGLCHNDVLIYEPGWNVRLWGAFEADLQLGLVGLCGSNEADENGGRGGGTMCHFRGEHGQSQAAGLRITDLRPSVMLDSLFMMFRTAAVLALDEDWDDLPLAHFYDKIWPLQLWKRGWRVGTMGIECDHAGGITIVANQRYAEDCKIWFHEKVERALHIDTRAHGADGFINYELAMYLEAERRLLGKWRDESHFIPCWVDPEWKLHKGHP